MRCIPVLLSLLCQGAPGFAQCKHAYNKELHQMVYTYADKMPEYAGDHDEFLSRNFQYPEEQKEYQFSFSAYVIVDTSGNVIYSGIRNKATKDLTPAERELVMVLRKMPKWKPGRCGGKKVVAEFSLPIKISLQ